MQQGIIDEQLLHQDPTIVADVMTSCLLTQNEQLTSGMSCNSSSQEY